MSGGGFGLVVGLSGKARHGKGSVVQLAQILLQSGDDEREVRQVSFATALKAMARELVTRGNYFDIGLPRGVADELWRLGRSLTVEDIRTKTPGGRKFLQFLGTEAMRKNVDDLFWVKRAAEKIRSLPKETLISFVPDVRFPNEADFIVKEMGGQIWRIERLNEDGTPFDNGMTPENKVHVSETALDEYKADVTLRAKNMADLFDGVKAQLKLLGLG